MINGMEMQLLLLMGFDMKKIIIYLLLIFLLIILIVPSHTFSSYEKNTNLNNSYLEGDSFDRLILFIMDHCYFPSLSVSIIKNDSIAWTKGYGYANIENEIFATNHTIYAVGSISKSITSTALLQLYDSGLYHLDDDVNNYLPFSLRNPNFPNESITFRMILSHSSSILDELGYYNVEYYNYSGPPFEGYPMPWLEEYLTPGGELFNNSVWDNENVPGSKFSYANINYDIVAYLVEILSEKPFYLYCYENIFQPLGMDNTGFHISVYNETQLSVPYYWFPIIGQHKSQHVVMIHYMSGGLFTNVVDLSKFMIIQMSNGSYNDIKILEKETVEEMHKIQSPSTYYGLGWETRNRKVCFGTQFPFYTYLNFPNMIYSGNSGLMNHGVSAYMYEKIGHDTAVIFFVNSNALIYRSGFNAFQLLRELFFQKACELYYMES